ncbi:inorganic triphosphatase [Rhizobium wenxiniae]|uniref:Inorganic triphosphatase YgiF n=1 Tax=Rhizobium wenxiniae TaxID=1737357 RepID=A0A7X0D3J8_9HYPH|nr:CHAD domain-containing protein [Rhizobium wenxiniae]MBB6165521.1 inorganic triphosphatase YgiF [Rhizobium wenxiniae]GGG17885.1 inorganic triphosphatase [Rhizobium wenxiniae]
MPEVELKLEIQSADVDRLVAADLFKGEPRSVSQGSIYFDTPDNLLFASGFTLRIRQEGDTQVQTIKATGPSASIFARDEWEFPVAGKVPVLDHSSPLLNEFDDGLNDVAAKFEVSNERRIWTVNENGSTIEVALDIGCARAVDREAPFVELELELKDGEASDLFVLARKIEAVVPVRFGVLSKAERGYRLMEAARSVVKAEPIELDRGTSTADAFKAIMSACFRQFRLNEEIMRVRQNPESLHQARVALRRLRSAITLFKPILRDGETKRLSGELRWLADVLGEVRNIDVLLPKAKPGQLRDKLSGKRASAYEDVMVAIDSSRTRALMLDFYEWLHCGEYLRDPASRDIRERKVDEFASEALDKARKKLKKHGRDLAGVDDEHRHEARKDAKKLRYASEFFRSLFSDKKGSRRYKRFVSAMETLQDELGALNDLATGPEVLRTHGISDIPGLEYLVSHADKQALVGQAQSALEDVLDAKRFWR